MKDYQKSTQVDPTTQEPQSKTARILEVLKVSSLLGVSSFGGPIAHLGYFHNEYVAKRKWIDEHSYADLVALCQFLPGPASSQVGIGIGAMRAGLWGGLAAWVGFTLPSAIVLMFFALLIRDFSLADAPWLHGLKIVAVAIVAHSILAMGKKLASTPKTATIAALATAITLLWQTALTQVAIILAAGLIGVFLFRDHEHVKATKPETQLQSKMPFAFLIAFAGLLFVLPMVARLQPNLYLQLFDSFYRSGSLVFGGGHVVLPLLELEVVPTGLITEADFLAGYGAAQAVPGPLFTFASYLGAMIAGVPGAAVALAGIFLPAFLLVIGVIPYWDRLRANQKVKAGLVSVNAAVVGILLAALYHPLWTNAILNARDFILAMILFVLLTFWKVTPLLVVLAGALGGWIFSLF